MYQKAPVNSDSLPDRDFSGHGERLGTDLHALMAIFKRHYILLLCCILFGTALGSVAAFLPPNYEMAGRIQVRSGSANMYMVGASSLLGLSDENAKLESEVTILQSDTLLLHVASELNLANNPTLMYKKYKQPLKLDDPTVAELVLKQFSLTPLGRSRTPY